MRPLSSILPTSRAYWILQATAWSLVTGMLLVFYWPYAFARARLPYFALDMSLCFLATFALRSVGRRIRGNGSGRLLRSVLFVFIGSLAGFVAEAISEVAARLWLEQQGPIAVRSLLGQGVDYAILLGAWCAFYLGIQSFLEARRTEQWMHDAQRLAEEAQLRTLRSQVQPHFLFNSLNAASSLVVAGHAREARWVIEQLDSLLCAMLDSQDSHLTDLATELRNAKKYVEMQQVRFGERLKISFDIQPGLEAFHVPRWFLVPLLENAVKYGLSAHRDGMPVRIEVRENEQGVVLSVWNQIPLEAEAACKGFGTGLHNTRALLRTLYGEFASLSVDQSLDAFVLHLQLPSIERRASQSAAPQSEWACMPRAYREL